MGITVSFIFCLLSGLFAFWLFWKCVDWFRRFKRENYVHSFICIRYCNVRVSDLCADKTRKVLMNGEWRNEH